jgi:hypothetical protein
LLSRRLPHDAAHRTEKQMNRTILFLAAAAAFLVSRPAFADGTTGTTTTGGTSGATSTTSSTDSDADSDADAALADKAQPPRPAKTLPSQAAQIAKDRAFGQRGDAERLAHSQAGKHGDDAADDAHADAANRAAQGAAASAAGAANGDAHSAAGQARSTSARSSHGSTATTTTSPSTSHR